MPESKPRIRARRAHSGILSQFHCESISYELNIPAESFNRKAFSRKTGLKLGERWSAGIYPKKPESGYHIHFKGIMEKEHVRLTVEYWDGSFSQPEDTSEPFAESIMKWIGSFVSEPTVRVIVDARFEKPRTGWRSRFNLPLKVTMGGAEVVIDGIGLVLPKNPFKATDAFLTTTDTKLLAFVQLLRSVEFADFKIGDEIIAFNEAVKIFAEEVPT
jgi:hypothetical protein